jgi:Na+-transporting NADH:ubiquinone oxidoreductase subunit A
MVRTIKIKKGLDIPMGGAATGKVEESQEGGLYAIVPEDYPGYTWKVCVKPGDVVKSGSPLLYAKEDEGLKLTSPVSGVVDEIHRGERRKIEYVSVKKEGAESETISKPTDKASLLTALKESGLFALLRQRPFDIVPQGESPRDIFVTGFDSAPLAPTLLTDSVKADLEAGLKALQMLTTGKVYLGLPKEAGFESKVAETYEFVGPHPAGNVGVQIAAISPVNKGEEVWTLDVVTAARIGKLASKGEVDYSTVVAVTGEDVKTPKLLQTTLGAKIATLIDGNLAETGATLRVISGNVLTGKKVSSESGFLRYPYRQITVIDEGDQADEFMGWASLAPGKYSVKRTFPAFLMGLSHKFRFDARIKGGHRAMILSGEYDKVFPFDIYPEYLIKAIMAKNIERMEELGIYEVAPEDFALPEFVDTSKIELQQIVREGLDYLRSEI